MSIRAYIRVDHSMTDNEGIKWYRKDLTFVYNLWRQENITNLLFEYGATDYTNIDSCGQIEMCKTDFDRMYYREYHRLSDFDKGSIKIIKDYFKRTGSEFVCLECF